MIETESNGGWFAAGVMAVISTLASAVAFLFKLVESKNSAALAVLTKIVDDNQARIIEGEKRHDECQEDRIKLTMDIAKIQEHVRILEMNQCKIEGHLEPKKYGGNG